MAVPRFGLDGLPGLSHQIPVMLPPVWLSTFIGAAFALAETRARIVRMPIYPRLSANRDGPSVMALLGRPARRVSTGQHERRCKGALIHS
jgi:hypothetical protein